MYGCRVLYSRVVPRVLIDRIYPQVRWGQRQNSLSCTWEFPLPAGAAQQLLEPTPVNSFSLLYGLVWPSTRVSY